MHIRHLLFFTLLGFIANQAHGQNLIRSDIRIGVGVLATCQINSVNDIGFGTLDPNSAVDSFAQGELVFACTRGMSYKVSMSNGLHFDNNLQTRQMASDAHSPEYLPYALSINRQTGIGNGFQNPTRLILNANIRGANYRDISAGGYSDTIRITFEP